MGNWQAADNGQETWTNDWETADSRHMQQAQVKWMANDHQIGSKAYKNNFKWSKG